MSQESRWRPRGHLSGSPGPTRALSARFRVAPSQRERTGEQRTGASGGYGSRGAQRGCPGRSVHLQTWAFLATFYHEAPSLTRGRGGMALASPIPLTPSRSQVPAVDGRQAAVASGGLKTLPQDHRCWVDRNAPWLSSPLPSKDGACPPGPRTRSLLSVRGRSVWTPRVRRARFRRTSLGRLWRPMASSSLLGASGHVGAGLQHQPSLRTPPLLSGLLEGSRNELPCCLPLPFTPW